MLPTIPNDGKFDWAGEAMATYFENPSNNYVEAVTTPLSWLWAFISLVAAVFTFAATNIIFAFAVHPIMKTHYRRMGWRETSPEHQAFAGD